MALAEVCGIAEASYMKDKKFSTNDFYSDIITASGNFENNYQLACPPFANVRLCLVLLSRFLIKTFFFHLISIAMPDFCKYCSRR